MVISYHQGFGKAACATRSYSKIVLGNKRASR